MLWQFMQGQAALECISLKSENLKAKELYGGKRYRSFDFESKRIYGQKTIKLSIDGGFGCPNREGGRGGCIFCSQAGSGEFTGSMTGLPFSIGRQLEIQRELLSKKWNQGRYIAYFQNFTNTYGPIDVLRERYEEACAPQWISGMALATRPDCLSGEVLELLSQIKKLEWVELGLQTVVSGEKINRGYDNQVFQQGVRALQERGIPVVAHVIFGLPGESREDMLKSVAYAAEAGIWGIKLHMLYVDRTAPLFAVYQKQPFPLLTREEYVDIVCEALAILPEQVVIHRLTGDGKRENLIAPLWTADKLRVLSEINRVMAEKQYMQGCKALW